MRRGRRQSLLNGAGPAVGQGGGWEILYTGFIMILLCFFIMLASFAALEKHKVAQVAKSVEASLRLLPGGRGVLPPTPSTGEGPAAAAGDSEVDKLFAILNPLLRDHGAPRRIALLNTHRGPVMRLSDQALFTSGSAELGPQSRRLLRELAVVIAPTGWSMRVEGHTDDRPIRSERYPSNWELSTARAVSVLRFLEGQGVLDRARLAAAGYGEQRPLVPNGGPWQRAKNRRVEILFRQGPAVANVSGENP